MAIKACLFDAYGTLLDIASATHRLVETNKYPALSDKAGQLTEIWRTRQLHYSWLRSLMGSYDHFWQLTQDGLDFALEATGLAGDEALRADLLTLYRHIEAYDDGRHVLEVMARHNMPCGILSNGNQSMLDEAAQNAGLTPYLDKVLSVETLQIFKPAPAVYQFGCDAFNAKPDEILFFSSNGWDIGGAASFGYQTIWVNRSGQPQEYLPQAPHHQVRDLAQAADIAAQICGF